MKHKIPESPRDTLFANGIAAVTEKVEAAKVSIRAKNWSREELVDHMALVLVSAEEMAKENGRLRAVLAALGGPDVLDMLAVRAEYGGDFAEGLEAAAKLGVSSVEIEAAKAVMARAVGDAYKGAASNAAKAKHAKGKKGTAKVGVYGYFGQWLEQPTLYASAAEFARDMLEKFPDLTNTRVIERWVTAWRKVGD